MWAEHAWIPPIQRQHDRSIMDAINNDSKSTRSIRLQCQWCRLYLKVISISDLTDAKVLTFQGDGSVDAGKPSPISNGQQLFDHQQKYGQRFVASFEEHLQPSTNQVDSFSQSCSTNRWDIGTTNLDTSSTSTTELNAIHTDK